MGKQVHQSIVELNGQRFNAQTGKLIDGVSMPIASHQTSTERQPLFERETTASKQVHMAAQPSKTLMRSAVKKPSTITDHKTVAMDVVMNNPGQAKIDAFHAFNPEREHRAEAVHQNTLVSRFGGELRETVTTIKPVAITQRNAPEAATPISIAQTAPSRSAANTILNKGLQSAHSHQAVIAKKAHIHHRVGRKLGLTKRATSLATGGLAILVIGGFFVYRNIPSLSVRYASAKAGINASLPTYQPAGFAVNSHIAYSPGQIAVAYRANADNRTYTVTQKNTSWNSDALKDHLMSLNGTAPESYPDEGRIIYLHDGSEADWVNNGVWYSISGDSSLNTDQLIKIATSL